LREAEKTGLRTTSRAWVSTYRLSHFPGRVMNHPFTAEQCAQMREQRARQVREMSAETFAALKRKLQQSWAALGRDEQALLVQQRRVMPSTSDSAKS